MADEQPSWLGGSSERTAEPTGSKGNASDVADLPEPPFKPVVKMIFSFFNLGFMVFLAAVGALGVGGADNIDSTGVVFVGLYLIVFAAIVFIYECAQLCPVSIVDNFMKKNFGFLYGVIGKGIFELFIGILAFGLQSPRSLAIACGILLAAWGPLQIVIWMKFPEYFDVKEKYQP